MSESVNDRIVDMLRETGELLALQNANPFRVNAYQRAARTVRGLDRDVGEILATEGRDGLIALPGIGQGIASMIEEVVRSGTSSRLQRLRGELDSEQLFQTVPGIGPRLAHTLHEDLHIDTLEALEMAAHDGRLASLPGLGPRRAQAIRASLESVLGGRAGRRSDVPIVPVAVLLDVDATYRKGADADTLPRIAPRRFNPEHRAWLPILHADRDEWHFTALYSNTARAHELEKTRDWVVIYFYDGDHREGQHTVVTETSGALKGRRVVRGREVECQRYYDAVKETSATTK